MKWLRNEGLLRAAIAALALLQLGFAVEHISFPRALYGSLAGFGVYNEHFLRDYGTYFLAFGVTLLAAIFLSSWRAPLLTLGFLQYLFHALNHLLDIGKANPGWVGPLDVVLLGAGAAAFFVVLEGVWSSNRVAESSA